METSALAGALLAWYDHRQRQLPWRATTGTRPDPYGVWLSEIMLQQTTVATVRGYYDAFLTRWPTVTALAAAELDEVLHAWQGLGYYARARNLHACAQVIANQLDGHFPSTEAELRQLPGIGPYTAAAIAAIVFDQPTVAVDGNVERVVARLFCIKDALPAARPSLRQLAQTLAQPMRPGDFAQSLIELGATVCKPRTPDCTNCPIAEHCRARAQGVAASLPVKTRAGPRPTRYGVVFWLEDSNGYLWVRRRPPQGLLGGLMEFPSTPWRETPWRDTEALTHAPPLTGLRWHAEHGEVHHTFTHFHLILRRLSARAASHANLPEGRWVAHSDLATLALPTVMKKVAQR